MENITIAFDADVSGLTKAVDILEKLGKITKKDADDFRTLTKSSNEFQSSQDGVQKELTETEKLLAQIALQGQKTNSLLQGGSQTLGATTKKTSTELSGMSSVLGRVGGAIAAAFAVEKIIAFGAESVKAFQEAEKAAIKLRSAVAVNGGLQQDFDELVKQSKELQGITIFSDEAIQGAQTAALQFGLTKDQVKNLLPVLADFASATGQDLDAALQNVLLGLNGVGKGLKNHGVFVDETQTKTERLVSITDQLTKKFDDQAKAIGETAFGAAEKYKNQLDDFQETIGERVSPIMQGLREQFLILADGATKGAEEIKKAFDVIGDAVSFTTDPFSFFANKAEQNAQKVKELTEKIKQENSKQIAQFKKDFEALGDDKIATKLNILSGLLEENRKQAQGLSAEEARSLNLLAVEYANQITALQTIRKERAQGVQSIDDQAEAINKLKNISSLSVKELNDIKKVLQSFNDINLSDEIEAIDKEVERRKKAGEKEIQNRQQDLENLHKLEQQASDENLKIKAAEVDKLAEIEQERQRKLKELVESFAKSQGASIEDLLKQFDDTGIIDLEEAFKRIEATEPPTAEFVKFKSAIDDTTESANLLSEALIHDNKIKSFVDQLKTGFENIDKNVQQTANDIDKKFTDKKISINAEVIQKGAAATPEEFEKLAKDEKRIDKEKEEALLANRIRGTQAKRELHTQLLAQLRRVDENAVLDDKDIVDEEVKNAQDAEKLKLDATKARIDAQKDLSKEQIELDKQEAALRQQIYQTAIDGIIDLLHNFNQRRADSAIESLESQLASTNEFLDKEIEANERAHQRKRKGDKDYERTKDELLKQREAAEKKTAKEVAEVKRKQAIMDKEIAIFNIILNTAAAVSKVSPVVPLMVLTAALGAIQLGIAIAQPIPKFAKGTPFVKSDAHPDGVDTVPALLTKGERVVTVQQNREHWDIYEAIDNNRFTEYINQHFVKPGVDKEKSLVKERIENEREKILTIIQSLPSTNEVNSKVITTLRNDLERITNTFISKEIQKNESGFSEKEFTTQIKEVESRISNAKFILDRIIESETISEKQFESFKEKHSSFTFSDAVSLVTNSFTHHLTQEKIKEIISSEISRLESIKSKESEKNKEYREKNESDHSSKYESRILKESESKEITRQDQTIKEHTGDFKERELREKGMLSESEQSETIKRDLIRDSRIEKSILELKSLSSHEIKSIDSRILQLKEIANSISESSSVSVFKSVLGGVSFTIPDRFNFNISGGAQVPIEQNTYIKAIQSELNEYAITRALNNSKPGISKEAIKQLGKEIAANSPKDYSPYHKI